MDARKFVKAWWFHAGAKIYGVVETKDDLGFVKHYIGGLPSDSLMTDGSEEQDAMYIARNGARFRIPSDLSTENDAP